MHAGKNEIARCKDGTAVAAGHLAIFSAHRILAKHSNDTDEVFFVAQAQTGLTNFLRLVNLPCELLRQQTLWILRQRVSLARAGPVSLSTNIKSVLAPRVRNSSAGRTQAKSCVCCGFTCLAPAPISSASPV